MTSTIFGSDDEANKIFKLKRIKITYVISRKILSKKVLPKRSNCFKHVKTSFSSTSGSENLSGFGESVIEDPLQWDCKDSPHKCSIQDLQMKTMSLAGKGEFSEGYQLYQQQVHSSTMDYAG